MLKEIPKSEVNKCDTKSLKETEEISQVKITFSAFLKICLKKKKE